MTPFNSGEIRVVLRKNCLHCIFLYDIINNKKIKKGVNSCPAGSGLQTVRAALFAVFPAANRSTNKEK